MIQDVLVLGSGSAGLIAALTIKRKLPSMDVRIVRDPSIGIIGVGEGTTPSVVRHLLDYAGIHAQRFYDVAKPTWKLGIHFKWGPRGQFNYTFDGKFDTGHKQLKRQKAFYCAYGSDNISTCSALMSANNAFPRQPAGLPNMQGVQGAFSFHVENVNLVTMLEMECRDAGVAFTDGKMVGADRGPDGVEAIHLENGRKFEADLFIDASGFRGELISGVMQEPFVHFDKTLFCDRAVVGGWKRTDEPILPYTIAEQMDAGWAWQIEHENYINRGYVFCSDMISDEQAFEEFRRKNPKVPETPRFVPFVSGHRKRMWVGNVFAIGNAGGFVEPMEASALMVICNQCAGLTTMLQHAEHSVTQSMRDMYNHLQQSEWSVIRDFLGMHYKLNTAPDTAFWRRCREETDLSGIQEVLDFYEENGPSNYIQYLLPAANDFGVDGFLAMLVYNQAPTKKRVEIDEDDLKVWNRHRAYYKQQAEMGVGVKEMLAVTRDPRWQWY